MVFFSFKIPLLSPKWLASNLSKQTAKNHPSSSNISDLSSLYHSTASFDKKISPVVCHSSLPFKSMRLWPFIQLSHVFARWPFLLSFSSSKASPSWYLVGEGPPIFYINLQSPWLKKLVPCSALLHVHGQLKMSKNRLASRLMWRPQLAWMNDLVAGM